MSDSSAGARDDAVGTGPGGDGRPAAPAPASGAVLVDLLGVLAAAELVTFERLAADAALAPTVTDKAALGEMAAAELRHFELLRDALVAEGADPEAVVARFVGPALEFHDRTRPADWYEGLMKAYVTDGMAVDFYRQVGTLVGGRTRELVDLVLEDTGHAALARDRILAAVRDDPRLGDRLALWGRRLVGEALAQAQGIARRNSALAGLLGSADTTTAGADGADGGLGRVLTAMTENHARRLAALGMSA